MNKKLFPPIIFSRYPANSVDFNERVLDNSFSNETIRFAEMLAAINSAIKNKNALVFVLIKGNSDRVDDQSLTIVQRKTKEHEASNARALSVLNFIFSSIEAESGLNQNEASQNPHFALQIVSKGSADLAVNLTNLNNEQRLQNRRVEIIYYVFTL